tara:strand:+ start:80 stop:247 length:168 start_codon:yes stop_codon:yes gene_type:complete
MSVELLLGPSIILILCIIGIVWYKVADSSDSEKTKEEIEEPNALTEFLKRMDMDN